MASSSATSASSTERQWYIVGRWEEFEGEARANQLRAIGIAAFYGVELINYHGLHLGFLELPASVERPFHLAVTLLCIAWVMVCFAVLYCRRMRYFPAGLKYASTAADIVLLTSVLALADGPRSPLVVAYFPLLALVALRLRLRLIRFATIGCLVGYLYLLGYARWFAPAERQAALLVPRYAQLIFVLGLVLTGVVLGQLVRRVRAVAEDYARRLQERQEAQP